MPFVFFPSKQKTTSSRCSVKKMYFVADTAVRSRYSYIACKMIVAAQMYCSSMTNVLKIFVPEQPLLGAPLEDLTLLHCDFWDISGVLSMFY